ncbi:T9SS type A sorting domain-containing protein [Flavobacterium sp.]|uniref:DUF7619 domain-containing protein n=1 Tax=Flavobacterium sp. TaxID=239 RepID=UPI002615E92F|nr:T9SS type A sorting domain-containing protein [Flavobacterium sp.]
MKKFCYVFVSFFTVLSVCGQNVNIPDSVFKSRLLSATVANQRAKDLAGNWTKLDANADGNIQVSEAQNISYLKLGTTYAYSLVGINAFSNLTYFSLLDATLFSLDIHGLQHLELIDVTYSGLNEIILYDLPVLKTLSVWYNDLDSLDVHTLTTIENLNCYENNLTSLDLSSLTHLHFLDCHANDIQYLNIKNGSIETMSRIEQGSFGNTTQRFFCVDDAQAAQVEQLNDPAFGNVVINDYCTFTPGGEYYTINGHASFDQNDNGCTNDDLVINNVKIEITNGIVTGDFASDASGVYTIPIQAGTHTITPKLEHPNYFNVSPPSTTVVLPNASNPVVQNFCYSVNGVHADLEIALLPSEDSRPGFDSTYKIIYKNKGTQTQSGTISFAYNDAVLDLVNSNPTFSSQVINYLNWDFTNLQPFESREISVTLNANSPMENPPLTGGDVLNFTASVNSTLIEETPDDNEFILNQTVVNSFDPNDKTCLEGNTITPEMVGKEVHYMIRFENTGTANAENIVVKDMIDTTKFDINSLIPIDGSHSFVTKISGTNKVEFIFKNINLPFSDANNDGYVAFKIKTKPSLVLGNTFSNTASIYFDYNFPIITNTATTTVSLLANKDFDFEQYFKLYPNPVKDVLNIETKKTIEVTSINVYNTLGQLILVIPNAQQTKTIDVSSLKTGNYFLKINSDKGTSSVKFVKM